MLLIINIGAISANAVDDNITIDSNSLNDNDVDVNTLNHVSNDSNLENSIYNSSNLTHDNYSDLEESSLTYFDFEKYNLNNNESLVSNSSNISKNSIEVENTTVIRSNPLVVYLKDDSGNTISGETVIFNIIGKNYTRTTDSNGEANLTINLSPNIYEMNLYYLGGLYATSNKSFNLTVLSNVTKFTLANKTIIKGNSLIVYFKDGSGNALIGKNITININSKNYTRITDSNGKANLTINLSPNNYTVNLYYFGGDYSPYNKSFNFTVIKIATKFTVLSTSIMRTDSLLFYLNDTEGNALAGQKVIITISGKNYTRTTDSDGFASITINLSPAKYNVKLIFSGKGKYSASTKNFTLTVKSYSANKNGIWLRNADKNNINYLTLRNNGIRNIYISYVVVNSSDFKTWLTKVNNLGFNVHIWMQVFYKSGWIKPLLSNGSINTTLYKKIVAEATSYAKISGVYGINLDYVRYPGTAYKYSKGEYSITQIVKQISTAVKKVNPNITLSCSVMGESLYSNAHYYGQNLSSLSKYVDVITPMLYKGNYNKNSTWIKTQTAIYVKAVNGNAEIWSGLQTYKSDGNLTKLSSSELTTDAKNALAGGASGVMFFRAGLLNVVNMTKLTS